MTKESSRSDEKSARHTPPPDPGGMNTGVAIIGFIMCFLAGAGLMWGYANRKVRLGEITADTASGAAWSDDESPIPVSSKDPMWGKREALVTIVHFSDFQCPFCGKVEPTLDQVKTAYGPDKVRIIWKNEPLPFHPNAKPAAEAAQGVFALKGNDAFWKFHETAFKNQTSLSEDNYIKWATAAGADAAKLKAGLSAHTWAKKVEEDHGIAQKAGVNGTPASYINGIGISGAQQFDKFKAVIDQELAKAEAKQKSGTPKDKLYVTLSKENFKSAPAGEEGEQEDTKTVWKVPVGKSPVKGPAGALVTIIEFSDFQCPYCKKVEDSLAKVFAQYQGKVRLVWKNEPLPFHPRATPAAVVTLEARAKNGDKGFWDAHDKLFESQPKLEDADLETVSKALGLDWTKVKDAIENDKYDDAIDEDVQLGARVQANGTPHFFINGRRLVGAQPVESFSKVIDEEVKKAEGLLQKGTKPEALYDALIADGKDPPVAAAAPEQPLEKKQVAMRGSAAYKGPAGAKVTIQEFSDFQCPYCKKVEDTVKKVMRKNKDVKLVWRHMPLEMHQDAPLASEAAEEAYKQKGADGFWKMHDLLFNEGQGKENGLKREALDGYATKLGLDMEKFKGALDNRTHKATIDADAKAGKDAGIQGTPAFVINGYFINGAQPYKEFKRAIEKAAAEAK